MVTSVSALVYRKYVNRILKPDATEENVPRTLERLKNTISDMIQLT